LSGLPVGSHCRFAHTDGCGRVSQQPRRYLGLVLNLVLVACGGVLAISVEYLTSSESGLALPSSVGKWIAPAAGVVLVAALAARIRLYYLEHPRATTPWPAGRSPYPGLEPLTEQEADVFFARQWETQQLLDRLSPASRARVHRVVPVIGPSGVGKSSLVRAGLVPGLARRFHRWVVVHCTPEAQPFHSLAASLAPLVKDGAGVAAHRLASELATDPASLAHWVEQVSAGREGSSDVLLIVDQAEELVTLSSQEDSVRFLEHLEASLSVTPRLWVIMVLRSDFLTAFLELGFSQLFQNPVLVGPLDRASLHQVVEGPAARAGLSFAPGVVSQMISDTGSGDALPLLAYTLHELYDRVGAGGRVSMEHYHAVGGVSGALVRQADRWAAELQAQQVAASVPETLSKLVSLQGDEPVRRRVPLRQLSEPQRRVMDAFVRARLLRVVGDGESASAEVTHEALFRQWAPLRQAIAELADDMRQRGQLEAAAGDWEASGRSGSYLLRDDRLERALAWVARLDGADGELGVVREFLDQSTLSDVAAMARLSDAVARHALAAVDRDPELAVLLALAAVDECGSTPLAHRALLAAMAQLRTRLVLRGHDDAVRGVAWAPHGDRIASASHDRTVRIWDLARPTRQPVVLRGHEDWVRAVAWSPNDAARLATGSNDRTLRIWDIVRNGPPEVRNGHTDLVHAVAWSPTGRWIATGSHDRTARLWPVERDLDPVVLRGHDGWVRGVAWSPDERKVATGGSDTTIRIWDARTGEQLSLVGRHDDWVLDVAWSPDGRRLATASNDGTVRVWGDPVPLVLHGHQDWVQAVAWSPDGHTLASASRDRTGRLWDAETGAELAVLRGHTEWVHDVAWSSDGATVATASHDQTIRIWEPRAASRQRQLEGHLGTVQGVAWSPDSARIATASHDCTVRIWSAHTGQEVARLSGHRGYVHDVAWSPDGGRVVSASRDLTATVWAWPGGTVLGRMTGHENWVEATAWSPDGSRIATASNDRTARLWDAGSFAELVVLRGHTGWVRAVAWSPDGHRVATGSNDRTCRIWRTHDGAHLVTLTGHQAWIEDVAWAPDGQRLATASHDHTARIWDPDTGAGVAALRGHDDWVRGVSWSPDGRLVATASADHTARIWDARSGAELAVLYVHDAGVESVAWSPDGSWVATGCQDGKLQISAAVQDMAVLVAEARRRVPRQLSPEERRRASLPG
jgi:WD40 repeat protein